MLTNTDSHELAFERAIDRLDDRLCKGFISMEDYEQKYLELRMRYFPGEVVVNPNKV